MLADRPENFVLYFVPNKGICCGGFVQEFHHHALLAAVAFRHEGPYLGSILAGVGAHEERLFLRATQMEVVARALVQVKNHVQIVCLDILDGLVQQGENFVFRLERSFVEQVKVVHRQTHVVEPHIADALEIAVA